MVISKRGGTMATTKKKPIVKKPAIHRSFRPTKESADSFFTFRFTQQTAYWLILSLLILALGVWVMYLTVKVQSIYDEIDATNMSNSYTMPLKRTH
jgi:hypothetical protein